MVKISHIHIDNFRSIQSLDMDLNQVCALVGPNNAGKTNLLMAMNRVLGRDWVTVQAFNESDVYGRDPSRDISIVVTFDEPIPYYKFKASQPAEISSLSFLYTRYKRGEQVGERRLEQTCLNPKGGVVQVPDQAPKSGVKTQYKPLSGIPGEVRDAVPLIHIGTNRSLHDQLPSNRYSLLRPLIEDIDRDFRDPNNSVLVQNRAGEESEVPRVERFEALMRAGMTLLRTDSFRDLESTIKERALRLLGLDPASDALDFFFAPFDTMTFYKNLELHVREAGFDIDASELGGGMQNALVLAILQAYEQRRKQGAIILIEEPEMFLHPQVQRSVYKTLQNIGKSNQVIYTTHSPHFVTLPDYRDVQLVRRRATGTEAQKSELPMNDIRRDKLVKELDPERNELFFASRLLLVEGDTEKLALPEYAKNMAVDLDEAGATIVEVGGKRNLMEIAGIAISFGIPTGVVYDEDSSDFRNQRADEESLNGQLDALARDDRSVRVWRLVKNYEDHLRGCLGEEEYQRLCNKFASMGKPTRARRIAQEPDLPIPPPFGEILDWLVGQPVEGSSATDQ
jgi:ABC-type cobalamin/Fe3+-siderophores transport system ATPase subunit